MQPHSITSARLCVLACFPSPQPPLLPISLTLGPALLLLLPQVWGKTGAKLYGPKSGADFVDNHKRFALFNKAAIEAVKVLPFGPGEDCVFVANDWHSALLPVVLKDVYQARGEFKGTKCALCIHNVAFQGRMWADTFKELGLPASSMAKFEFTDGNARVYTEDDPLADDEAPVLGKGQFKKVNWLKVWADPPVDFVQGLLWPRWHLHPASPQQRPSLHISTRFVFFPPTTRTPVLKSNRCA